MTELITEIEAAIVPVKIKEDHRKIAKRYLRTTFKCYTIDPVNNLTAAVLPYNPRRYKAVIMTNDAGVILSADNPTPAAVTDTATLPPPGNAIHVATMAAGFSGVAVYGPDPFWLVAIVGAAATRVNVIQHIWCYDE